MAAITAAMVKELRVKTDAPMMECKKALTEADGDMAKAEEILRRQGSANKATKAAARIAAEGVVAVYLSDDRKLGAILEVNSETDFVARTRNSCRWLLTPSAPLPNRTRPTSKPSPPARSAMPRLKKFARASLARSAKT